MRFKNCVANLGVEDVNKTIEFYQKKLGFQVVMTAPEEGAFLWGMVKRDDVTIMFQRLDSMKKEYEDIEASKPDSTVTFYIEVDDIQSLYDDILTKMPAYVDIHNTFYGAREFAIKDINGYRLIFAEHKA